MSANLTMKIAAILACRQQEIPSRRRCKETMVSRSEHRLILRQSAESWRPPCTISVQTCSPRIWSKYFTNRISCPFDLSRGRAPRARGGTPIDKEPPSPYEISSSCPILSLPGFSGTSLSFFPMGAPPTDARDVGTHATARGNICSRFGW